MSTLTFLFLKYQIQSYYKIGRQHSPRVHQNHKLIQFLDHLLFEQYQGLVKFHHYKVSQVQPHSSQVENDYF